VFILFTLTTWALNGAALVVAPAGLITAALVFGIVAAPIMVYAAYRAGEIASEEYRRQNPGG
jgi:hypothetical protein